MLSFSDEPYVFVEPRPCPPLIGLMRVVNRFVSLKAAGHRITDVDVLHADRVARAAASGKHLLFLPNHSTHSDVEIITEAFRQLGVPVQYMAAYDVFRRSWIRSWLMQRGGAFSVDREGSDKQSMKQAVKTLVQGEYGLTIFPEGNVHFTNERVTPFLEGAAFIALQAQRELAESAEVVIVPVGIKVTHVKDQRQLISKRLNQLAEACGTTFNPNDDIVSELSRIGLALLRMRLREGGYAEVPDGDDLGETLRAAAASIISRLEAVLELKPRPDDSVLDRARRVRRDIHETLLQMDADSAKVDRARAAADDAMLALRIVSYSTDYVSERPTLDRVGETVEKLKEDLYDAFFLAYAPRHAAVSFGKPISARDFQEGKLRTNVAALTEAAEQAVQNELNCMIAKNTLPGSELF